MVNIPMSSVSFVSRDLAVKRFAASDAFFRLLTRSAAYLVLTLLGGFLQIIEILSLRSPFAGFVH